MIKQLLTLITLLIAGLLAASLRIISPTADEVMKEFQRENSSRSENELMNPLFDHANTVKYKVIEAIRDPGTPRRRYAIGFLGIESVKEAMPTLENIILDDAEVDYFRGDALESIWQIDRAKGIGFAQQYRQRNDFLGYIAKGLLDGSVIPLEKKDVQTFGDCE